MRRVIFVTGGQRSGKSKYAQNLAESLSDQPIYMATARHWDADFDARIKRHQDDRGDRWTTLEEEVNLSAHDLSGQVVLLDCVTLWLTNIYSDNDYDTSRSLDIAKAEWCRFVEQDFTLIVVSNEIGMGTHASEESARHFADLQGWINQFIAQLADEVIFMVSGIPVPIKKQ